MPASTSIPTHSQWKKFKTTHGVASNAVGSVDVGKALDAFHKAFGSNMSINAKAADACAKELIAYFSKFPDKAAADPKKFKAEFEKVYVKPALAARENFKAMAGEKAAFGGRVALLLDATAKLKVGDDLNTLQVYRQGPVRGMLAAAAVVKYYNPKKLHALWKPIDDMINKLKNPDQKMLDSVVKVCHETAKTSMAICKEEALF